MKPIACGRFRLRFGRKISNFDGRQGIRLHNLLGHAINRLNNGAQGITLIHHRLNGRTKVRHIK